MMPEAGDRVEITALMSDDPSPLPVGLRGTVVALNPGFEQIYVNWDVIEGQGRRSLILLGSDPFKVVGKAGKVETDG